MRSLKIKELTAKATGISLVILASSQVALATTPTSLSEGVNSAQPNGASSTLFNGGIFTVVADTLIFLVGAVSVIMLIVGGLRYVLSSGNSSAVEGAKNTILYAIIGLVVAAAAFAIVSFVVGKLNSGA